MSVYDLICKKCGHTEDDYVKKMTEPFPDCPECGELMGKNWNKCEPVSVTWKGPGNSPLRAGGPSKYSFNTNKEEVEQEMFNSITEEE
jgi:predicted nucleic acid-binding Zn ribbon protein